MTVDLGIDADSPLFRPTADPHAVAKDLIGDSAVVRYAYWSVPSCLATGIVPHERTVVCCTRPPGHTGMHIDHRAGGVQWVLPPPVEPSVPEGPFPGPGERTMDLLEACDGPGGPPVRKRPKPDRSKDQVTNLLKKK